MDFHFDENPWTFPKVVTSAGKWTNSQLRKEAAEAAATVVITADNSQPPAFPDPVSALVTQPSPAAIPAAVDHSHSASASNHAWNEIVDFADEDDFHFWSHIFCTGCYLSQSHCFSDLITFHHSARLYFFRKHLGYIVPQGYMYSARLYFPRGYSIPRGYLFREAVYSERLSITFLLSVHLVCDCIFIHCMYGGIVSGPLHICYIQLMSRYYYHFGPFSLASSPSAV